MIALICALTGTAFAASQLGKNSVGTKQLKSNAVTTAKIKKEAVTANKIKKATITGKQINLAKLGTVPHASLADTVPQAEAVRIVGAAGQPPFLGGASNAPVGGGVSFVQVGFYKDQFGIVHLQGVVKKGTGGGLPVIFQLPPGYRPPANQLEAFSGIEPETIVLIAGSGTTLEGTNIEGDVLVSGSKEAASFGGISFRAAS